ncbi:hypothetical protein V5O48_007191 [Marasmius crinis-equi]|uniref:Uncharacterized protein n=1 Tax=Marasmius crinis-equi TaxID=585013 RepID=A0ABR3FHV5_9AGAR
MTEYPESSAVQSPLESPLSTIPHSSFNIDPTILQLGLNGLQRLQAERAPGPSGLAQAPSLIGNGTTGSLLPSLAPETATQPSSQNLNIQKLLASPALQSLFSSIGGREQSSVAQTQQSTSESPSHTSPHDVHRAELDSTQTAQLDAVVHEPISASMQTIQNENTNTISSTIPDVSALHTASASTSSNASVKPYPDTTHDESSLEQCRTSMLSLLLQNIQLRNTNNNSDLQSKSHSVVERAKGVLTDDMCKAFLGKMSEAKAQLQSTQKGRDLLNKSRSSKSCSRIHSPSSSLPGGPTHHDTSHTGTPTAVRSTPSTSYAGTPRRLSGSTTCEVAQEKGVAQDEGNPRKRSRSTYDGSDEKDSSLHRPRVRPRTSYTNNPLCLDQSDRDRSEERVVRPRSRERIDQNTGPLDSSLQEDGGYEMSIPHSSHAGRQHENISMNGHVQHTKHDAHSEIGPAHTMVLPRDNPGSSRPLTPVSNDMDVDMDLGTDSHPNSHLNTPATRLQQISPSAPGQVSAPDSQSGEKPVLPCHSVPGLWFVKPALDHAGILDCTFEIDEETAQKWHLQHHHSMYDPSSLQEIMIAKMQFRSAHGTSITDLKLNLLCLSQEGVMSVFASKPTNQEATADAVWNTAAKEWPKQGTLLIQVNPGKSYGTSWMPHHLLPDSPPLDVTNSVGIGTNVIRCIQLSPAQCFFVLHATVGTSPDWAGFGKFLGDSSLHDPDINATAAFGT